MTVFGPGAPPPREAEGRRGGGGGGARTRGLPSLCPSNPRWAHSTLHNPDALLRPPPLTGFCCVDSASVSRRLMLALKWPACGRGKPMGANETRKWLVGSEVRRRTVVKRRHYPSSKCTPPADTRYTRQESLPTKIMDFPGKVYHVQLTFRNSRCESVRV